MSSYLLTSSQKQAIFPGHYKRRRRCKIQVPSGHVALIQQFTKTALHRFNCKIPWATLWSNEWWGIVTVLSLMPTFHPAVKSLDKQSPLQCFQIQYLRCTKDLWLCHWCWYRPSALTWKCGWLPSFPNLIIRTHFSSVGKNLACTQSIVPNPKFKALHLM
jgi:hypothetical protein